MQKLKDRFRPINTDGNPAFIFGRKAESKAADYLKKQGYRILNRNYNCRFGEIDIIAKKAETICFVEVKARINLDFGPPAVFVTSKKQNRIKKTAFCFIKDECSKDFNYRFDVISVIKDQKGILKIELIEGAFE
ncbi:MAG: YraN family protein [Candidatus Omnitrophota bacterium]